ncbi:hypothetical protein QVD17_09405 [Tagetes erecta]|uniref:Uncharacterized protein n=1 Tax=Tagetes erecta TaxID=13708 RepID=A0AAD8L0W5_TARER|nr:hypothetical protein QVD17_09405 [Tagetes erecta]
MGQIAKCRVYPLYFVSLLEIVSAIYEKEPELLSGNDVLWTFVTFSGEDHSEFQTLVAFLKMLSALLLLNIQVVVQEW